MNYYGITIGPIVETISQASTPASLWYASYMFSELTHELCKKINELNESSEKWKGKITILTPAIESHKTEMEEVKGIGMYPDRIFFTVEESEETFQPEIKNIIAEIKSKNKNSFLYRIAEDCCNEMKREKLWEDAVKETAAYLEEYIQIYDICLYEDNEQLQAEGVVLALNKYLDVLELQKPIIPMAVSLPFQKLFYSKDKESVQNDNSQKNLRIKESHFFKEIIEEEGIFTLVKGRKENVKIRHLADIACPEGQSDRKKEEKKFHYYAIVQADGDNMGKYLKAIGRKKDIQKIKEFSEKCLQYTKESSKCIEKYKGTVIYAGGDDLLFLTPIQLSEECNLFHLLSEISETFEEKFCKEIRQMPEGEKLSVSFGVSICNTKFPLYENLIKARTLLFQVAKKWTKEKKCVAIALRKGNSKEMGICMKLGSDTWKKFEDMLSTYYCVKDGIKKREKIFTAVISKMETWHSMFQEAEKNNMLDNLFQNLFEDLNTEEAKRYLEDVKELMSIVFKDMKEYKRKEKYSQMTEEIKCVLCLLQFGKFLTEPATKGVDYE